MPFYQLMNPPQLLETDGSTPVMSATANSVSSADGHPLESPNPAFQYRPPPSEFQDKPTGPTTMLTFDTAGFSQDLVTSDFEVNPSDPEGATEVLPAPDNNFNREPKKEVCTNKRMSAIRSFVLLHLPAISVTLVLAVFYFKKVQWPHGHPTTTELIMLQFAAKAHESLILVSLTDILLHRIRSGLLREGTGGVPLGFLSSPFQLASPIRYLFSRELWGAILSPAASRRFHAETSVLIFLLVLIGLGASPLSAILMIPRQGWWALSYAPDEGEIYEVTYFVPQSDENPIYEIEPRFAYPSSSELCLNFTGNGCTQQNLEPFLATILGVPEPPFTPHHLNMTLSRYGRFVNPRTFTVYHPFTVIATSLMDFVATPLTRSYRSQDAIGLGFDVADLMVRSRPDPSSNMERWKQPMVAVTCAGAANIPSLENPVIKFHINGFIDRLSILSLELDLEADLSFLKETPLKDSKSHHQPDPIFLNIRDQVPIPISAAILFTSSVTGSEEIDKEGSTFETHICLVHARWIDADAWVAAEYAPAVISDFGLSISDWMGFLNRTLNQANAIKMADTWLTDIGKASTVDDLGKQTDTLVNNAYRQVADICHYRKRDRYGPSTCFSQFLAVYLTDALASMYRYSYTGILSNYPDREDIMVDLEYFTRVYAYSFRNSHGPTVALAVLLLHVVIVILHTGIILLSPRPWIGSGWGSFGQLMTLALRSRAPFGLENVGGGVSSSHTWKQMVTVRELADEHRLEMVVGDFHRGILHEADDVDEPMKKVEPMVQYS